MNEQELNQQVAEQICDAGQWNGQPFHAGKCVALLDGKVVAAADDIASVLKVLRSLDANPNRGMVFEVGRPVTDVIR